MADTIKLNSAIIEGFASSCLMGYMDNASAFSWFHRELWDLCTSDEKFVAIAAPRGHAKSTIVTIIYTLACILFRNRRYVLLVSDTEGQATLFLGQIKQILYDSKEIHDLFNIAMNEKGEADFEKDTETDIILNFKDGGQARIIAKGAEQKLRGMLWSGTRPDMIVVDDSLNEELVANKERRDKLRKWFYGSLIPCRSENGIIRMVGTPLNLDDPLESLMPKDNSKDTIHEDLKISSRKKKGMWKAVKYRAHNENMTKLLWPERKSKEDFEQLRADFREQGIPEVYSCEYLCNPVDDSIRFFKKNDFLALTKEDLKKELNYYVSGDLAISERDRADYTVFVVAGMDSDGVLHVKNVIRERMDGLTITETMLSLQDVYKPTAFGIEDMQVSKAIGPFLNRAMIERNIYLNVVPLSPYKSDKITRARSIQARMRASAVKFDKEADWYETFEAELLQFPRSKHDDCVDAMSYLGLIIDKMWEGRTSEEQEKDAYYEDMESSDLNELGRSSITGY